MKIKTLVSLITTTILVLIISFVVYRFQKLGAVGSKIAQISQNTFITRGDQLYNDSKFEQAYAVYSEAIQAGVDVPLAYARRGDIFMHWRKFQEASYEYTQSLSLERTSAVLANRCVAYRLLAKTLEALSDCNEAIQLDPTNVNGYLALIALQLEQGSTEEARKTAEKAYHISPDSAEVHYALYNVDLSSNNLEQAIKDLTEAIRLDPKNPQYYYDRGFAYYVSGKLLEAKADLAKTVEYGNPDREGELIYKAGSLMESIKGVP